MSKDRAEILKKKHKDINVPDQDIKSEKSFKRTLKKIVTKKK